jgi:peptide/nickel transport system permease protein
MLAYIGRRALLGIFTVWAISVLSFAIIQLPPGDYVTSYIAQMASMGSVVTDEEAQNLRIQYGLGQPIYVQYFKWMRLIVQGNFGMSMEWRRPVTEVIGERLWLTVIVSVAALILTWVLALPIGIYSAVRQYSVGDYVATFIGFIGRFRTSCWPWCCSTWASCCSTPTSAGSSRRSSRTRRGAARGRGTWPSTCRSRR